jgi:hypothetical protein
VKALSSIGAKDSSCSPFDVVIRHTSTTAARPRPLMWRLRSVDSLLENCPTADRELPISPVNAVYNIPQSRSGAHSRPKSSSHWRLGMTLRSLRWFGAGPHQAERVPKSSRHFRAWAIMVALKRASAIFVLLTMIFVVIAPALFADRASLLPACCRRDGKHQCAITSAESSHGPALKAFAEKCPLFPRATPTTQNHNSCRPVSVTFCDGAISDPVRLVRLDVSYRVPSGRSHQRRGPPLLT